MNISLLAKTLESNKSNSKYRVTFFSALPPFRGGISNFSELLVAKLEKISSLQAYTFKKQYPDFLFPGKTQFTEKPKRSFPRIVSTFNPLTYFFARRTLKKSDPEIFITNYWMTFFGPMMAFFARGFNRNVLKIAVIHNLIPHEKRFFDSFFNRLFLDQYDGFVVMSDAVRNDVLELKDDAKCLVLSHPPYNQFGSKLNQLEAKNILGLNPDKKTLLFFGLIRDYKGLDILLEAFSRLPDEFQLIVAGEVYGSDQVYQNLIEKSQNKNIVFINNYIPDQEVTNYFSAADLCVLPYKSATQSGIKAIADSFQVPVLTTNVGGLAELITPNKNGFIIENVDPEPLSNQIINLFNTEALDSVKSNLESKTNMENDEWKVFAQSLLQFSEELKRIK